VTTAQGMLQGELNFARVPQLLEQTQALGVGGVLDLSGVSNADSAGLALLLELSRRSKAKGLHLSIRGANEQIMQLARFFGLDQILHFE
jgi:phospholipid transport system transporter-binding protein